MNSLRDFHQFLTTNHPDLRHAGFAHVVNVGGLSVETPWEIAPGLQLRKALPNEVSSLQSLLRLRQPPSVLNLMPRRNPYETTVQSVEEKPGVVSYQTVRLAREEWRYHVVAFEGANTALHDFIDATALTTTRLRLGDTVFGAPGVCGPGIVGGGRATDELWNTLDLSDQPLLHLGQEDLTDLRDVYMRLRSQKEERGILADAIRRFQHLDFIPASSPLRFLGYVAILESLITHHPEPKDPSDSITRQVCQKMILIGRRSKIQVPYEILHPETQPKTIWKRLYTYRSKIAHGAVPDFRGDLKCLKDPTSALAFITQATVAVMRQTLEEPALVADLRAC